MGRSIVLPGLVLHPDGSFVRQPLPTIPANPDFLDGVACKDLTIDKAHNLWARVYIPKTEKTLLPVVVYYHGGGFIILSADYPDVHRLGMHLCRKLGAIVVSVNYCLAPEHRLPAAYEDGFAVLTWIKDVVPQLNGDLSRVFLLGDSAGGNIANHVAQGFEEDFHLKLAGLILIQPFFGGVSRTVSELKLGGFLTKELSDVFWHTSLPENADRDHDFCNVVAKLRKCAKLDLPRTLVVVGGEDVLVDRQIEYVEVLRQLRVHVELVKYEDTDHAFYFDVKSEQTVKLLDEIAAFVND